MDSANVSERRGLPPQVGVSIVILALRPESNDHDEDCAQRESLIQDPTAQGGSRRSTLWLPLVQRIRQPYLGDWALPGGDLRAGRSLEQSAYRALESTTHLRPAYLEQLYTFGDPNRSRGGLPMVSVVYWALVGGLGEIDYSHGDPHVAWFPEEDLPVLAFDHRAIIDYALQRLRSRIAYPQIATRLIGDRFTLAQLHDVYEAVAGRGVDLANFRRRMLASGQLEDTGEKLRQGRQRPATLYRYRQQEFADVPGEPPSDAWVPESSAAEPYNDPDEAMTALMTTGRELS